MSTTIIGWVGGKSRLVNQILPLIPEHKCFIEMFCGASWLLFSKPPSDVEIINDINTDLVTLYRVVKNHLKEFIRCMEWTLTSRGEYDRFKLIDPETLTDIQRAVRFYFLVKNTYGNKTDWSSFNVTTTKRPRINLLRIEQDLSDAHVRLSDVHVENKPYQYIFNRYDKPHSFIYIDPPYYECENHYGKGIFFRDDFEKLRDLQRECKSKFIMSINDHPHIRELYKEFHIRTVKTTYSLGGSDNLKKVNELLIMNYDPDKTKMAYFMPDKKKKP